VLVIRFSATQVPQLFSCRVALVPRLPPDKSQKTLTSSSSALHFWIVNEYSKKPIIGLLGGIASGKSTVASAFEKLGCAIINADLLAHNALEQLTIQQDVIAEFGPDILEANGTINRTAIANVVFKDNKKLARLNQLLHPWIFEKCRERLDQHQDDPAIQAVVLDMPLLMEVQWDVFCDHLVFVECPEKIRHERAIKRGVSPESMTNREIFQISLDKKALRADNMLINNSDLSSLVRQVKRIFTNIINK
jgi:dephospho-CoA kinase